MTTRKTEGAGNPSHARRVARVPGESKREPKARRDPALRSDRASLTQGVNEAASKLGKALEQLRGEGQLQPLPERLEKVLDRYFEKPKEPDPGEEKKGRQPFRIEPDYGISFPPKGLKPEPFIPDPPEKLPREPFPIEPDYGISFPPKGLKPEPFIPDPPEKLPRAPFPIEPDYGISFPQEGNGRHEGGGNFIGY